jgi:ribosomal protein S10
MQRIAPIIESYQNSKMDELLNSRLVNEAVNTMSNLMGPERLPLKQILLNFGLDI